MKEIIDCTLLVYQYEMTNERVHTRGVPQCPLCVLIATDSVFTRKPLDIHRSDNGGFADRRQMGQTRRNRLEAIITSRSAARALHGPSINQDNEPAASIRLSPHIVSSVEKAAVRGLELVACEWN